MDLQNARFKCDICGELHNIYGLIECMVEKAVNERLQSLFKVQQDALGIDIGKVKSDGK